MRPDAVSHPALRFIRMGGLGLALLSCGWISWLAWQSFGVHQQEWPQLPPLPHWLAAWLSCTVAMTLLAGGWPLLLRAAGASPAFGSASVAYALSQPAKYLPGNVLHFASRHAMGRADGHGHRPLVLATALEAASLIAVALGIAAIAGVQIPWLLGAHLQTIPWITAAVVAALCSACAWIVLRPSRARLKFLVLLLMHGVCASGYFLGTALAFWLLAGTALNPVPSANVLAAISLSWVGGFVVFGAPGGIGVREALLLQLLADGTATVPLLQAAACFRLTLIAADFTVFGLAWMWSRR